MKIQVRYIILSSVLLLGCYFPKGFAFYVICGLFDFKRSNGFKLKDWERYFFNRDLSKWLIWFFSPLNLFLDLLTFRKNSGIYELRDMPLDCQREINLVLEIANNNGKLIKNFGNSLNNENGMIFFKWYGKNIVNSINIPEFHNRYKYIKTVGVSIFKPHTEIGCHYGPLRVNLRVLYNLFPSVNKSVYIEVCNKRHFWCDDQLFIFDDTLKHSSVNYSDELRYCMFIDILRPARIHLLMELSITCIRVVAFGLKYKFYRFWTIIM